MAEFIQCAVDNGVGVVTLDRPEANNSLHADAAKELWEATTELTEDPTVRAILVRSNGKMFCSGGDLKYMLALEDEAALAKALKVTTTYFHAAVSRLTARQHAGRHGGAGRSGRRRLQLRDYRRHRDCRGER